MWKVVENKSQCCGCGACVEVCPSNAITMVEDGEGIPYPKIDEKKCIDCGRCEDVCPMAYEAKQMPGRVYLGVQAKEDAIRFTSASGGFFPVLACDILAKGGAVFGAAMEVGGKVVHRDIQTIEGLSALQTTKYVQSDLKGCYRKVAQYIEEDRQVLFTGTPCQCQAVKRYLGGKHENLLLADLVCYGAPSPGIWRKYVRELEKKYGGRLTGFNFRDKRGKDNGRTIALHIDNKEYTWPMQKDSYCRIYFRNYTLRPSCHECRFCTVNRESDITMGDFWGIENVRPELDDGMGNSMVILHTRKARESWESIKESFRYFTCQKEDVLQPRLCTPTPKSSRRRRFMLLNRFLSVRTAEKLLRY